MSQRIATAVLKLLTDDAEFGEGMERAAKKSSSTSDEIAAGFLKASAVIKVFEEAVNFVGAALSKTIAGTAEFGDKINDARQRTGLAAETLSKLSFAAAQSGTNFDDVSSAVGKMAKNMDGNSEAFTRLGISVKDAQGHLRPTGDVLGDVAEKFSHMSDGAQKTALAMEIFGKSGANMIPMLNEGRDGLKGMGDQAEKLGLVMNDKAAAAGDAFNDSMVALKGAATGLSLSLGAALLPALTVVVQAMTSVFASVTNWIKANGPLIDSIVDLGKNILVSLVDFVVRAITSMSDLVGLAASVAKALGLTGVAGALDKVSDMGLTMAQSLQKSNDKMADAFYATDKLGKAVKPLNDTVLDHADAIKKAADAHEKLGAAIMKNVEEGAKAFDKMLLKAVEDAEAVYRSFRSAVDGVKDSVVGNTEKTLSLVTAITEMESAGVRAEAIAFRLTSTLKTQVETAGLLGTTVDPLISKYFDLSKQMQQMADLTKLVNTNYIEWNATLSISPELLAEVRTAAADSLNAEVDGIHKGMEARRQANEEAKKAAESYQRIWEQATASVTSDFIKGLDDMAFHSQSVADAMNSIWKNFAESAFKAVMTGLFSPLTTKLSEMGRDLAKFFSGSGGGAASPSSGDIAGTVGKMSSLGIGFPSGGGGAANGAGAAAGGLGLLGTVGSVAGLAGLGWMAGKGIASLFGIGESEDEKFQREHPDAWKYNGQWFLPPTAGAPGQAWIDSQRMAEQQLAFNMANGGKSGGGGNTYNITVNGVVGDYMDVARKIGAALQQLTRDEGLVIVGTR